MLGKLVGFLGEMTPEALLRKWGKKALLSILGMVIPAGLAILNKKWGLDLTWQEICAPALVPAIFTPAQAYVDAKTGGLTSSLAGTPGSPSISHIKAGISPPPPKE